MSRPRFNPRGNFPLPRPRAPNPPGMRPPGPFMRPGPMGLPRFYPAGRARGVPHRFAGPESYPNLGPQRMNVQVTQHRTDPRLTKEKLEFHEAQQKKGKPHGSRWDDEPQLAAPGAVKPSSVAQGAEPSAKVQSRYTKESASSILASFGLSNEDLEELSRYPDEQLTPENMPLILRDIRMRKMGRRLPNLPSHGRTKEALGSESVSSNVIDYGHASKYGYTEDPLEVRIYDPEIPTDDVKNEFQSPQNISAPVPAPHVMCSSMFPVEDVFRQMDFPGESASQSFFPVESGTKMSGLHISGQSVLEPVKPISQSVSQTVSQTVSPSLIPPSINQPFSSQLISALSQQIPHKPVINSANVPDGPRGSKKSYQPEADMPIQSPFGIVRASWLPKFSHMDAQSMKRLPTPSMMNDYYAASPRIFPHLCSLCNVECSHLKDWIQHQNTSTHIESCRQLRQQYPDWNPEILPSRRSESIRKEDEAPRRRSHSPSPRRSRRSSSSHRLRRSRTPVRYAYRPRSRSPRICHRFISRYRYRCRSRSRSRSRSPYRRRLPFRGSPRYHRSLSPERTPRRSVRSSDRKKSLEDEQRSAHGAEASKLKYPDAAEKGLSPAQKPRTSSGAKPPAKPTSCAKSDASSGHAVRKSKSLEADPAPEGRHGTGKALSLQRKSRKDQSLSSNSILLISELPEDGCTEEDIRKVFQPFGKVNDVLIVPGRNEAYLEMEFKKAVAAIMKYNEATPLLVRGKGVKISVPGKRRSQNKEMKKKIPDSKKSSASALKKEANAAKTVETVTSTSTTKTGQPKVSSAKVNKCSGKSAGAVKSVVTVAAKGKAAIKAAKSVKKSLEARKAVYIKNKDSSKPTILSANSEPKTSVAATKRGAEETVSEDTLEATEKEPLSKEQEEMCVVLISNLPNKGYSTEEIYNLVKPFGGLKDILILSSHNKAYIEINRKSADSMVKFYTCFPICMDGNQLSLSLAPENMDITDEVALFTALIQESDPEANIDQIRSQFVHLDNLPEDGLQCVLCVGHQFGKVSHHVFMRNKNKAILQLESPESAQSMYSFLKQNPQSIGDHVLTCTLSPEMDSDAQTEKDPELGKQSPDLKKSPVDESEVQTAADSPSVNPSEVEEESAHNTQTAASVQQEELCGKEPVEALRDSDCVVETLGIETQGAEASTEIPLAASTAARPELLPDNTEGSALNQQVRARDFQKEEAEAVTPAAEAAVSGGVCTEARSIQGAVEEAPSQTEDLFSGVTEPVVEAAAEGEKPEVVFEVAPPACVVPQGPSVCVEDEEVESKKGISEESHVDAREESERHSKGSPEDCQVETEKAEKTEASVAAERPEKLLAGREKPPEQAAVKTSTDKGAGHPSQPEESEHASLPTVAHGWSSKPSVKAAVVSSKAKVAASKTENQKISLKSLLRDQKNAEKKLSAKEFGPLKSTRSGLAESSCKAKPTVSGASRRGSGRLSALQCKDAKPLDHKDVAKQSQETEPRPSTAKRDGGSNKAMAGQNTKNSKSTTGRSSKSKEEPLFTFDLDEFVTVDEVIEEVNLSQAEQTPLKGRRKELNSELNFKKKKGRTSVPHGAERELPFVTLDEVGEEEDAAAQALVTVDEVIDEEDLNVEEMVKNSNSLLTLDELIDHDESVSHGDPKDVTVLSVAEEQALLKQERLVTVDQIGEVEELPLGEPADMAFAALNAQAGGNASRGSIRFISSQLPEDPSALVTVDEIRDDSSDLHLVTLDEVTEEDGDSLADFNDLKEELDFVTVDEVGEEEDADNDSKAESALGRIARHTDKKGDRKRRALGPKKTKLELSQAGPAGETATQEDLKTMVEKHLAAKPPLKRLRIGKASASQKTVSAEAVKGSEALQMSREADEDVGSKDSEPDEKRRKMEDTGSSTSAAPDSPGDLDFLVPKAGFFCPICSLFYSGEKAMSNHCKSARHKENMERFMAKQRKEKEQSETEERSSR